VQFVKIKEQVKQGLLQPTQVEFMRNLVESTQLRQEVCEEQVAQGERQGIHAEMLELG
jgi:hypothetical protein